MVVDQFANHSPSFRDRSFAFRLAPKDADVLLLVAVLKPELPSLPRRLLLPVPQPVADLLPRPQAVLVVIGHPVRDAGEHEAHRGQPLLAVHDSVGGEDPGGLSGRGECDQGATVVRPPRLGGGRDRHQVLGKPRHVRRVPAVATLPLGYMVLNFWAQQLQETHLVGLHLPASGPGPKLQCLACQLLGTPPDRVLVPSGEVGEPLGHQHLGLPVQFLLLLKAMSAQCSTDFEATESQIPEPVEMSPVNLLRPVAS